MEKRQESQTTFRWHRDANGYSLFADGSIRRNGGTLVPYDPMAAAPNLHREFAELLPVGFEHDFATAGPIRFDAGLRRLPFPVGFDPKPALLDFVNRYGFLGSDTWGAEGAEGRENVDYLLKLQTEIAAFAHHRKAGGHRYELGKSGLRRATSKGANVLEYGPIHGPTLRMCLEADEQGRAVVRYRPESLYAWMWLRVADDMTSGIRWDGPPCLYCGAPMGRGPGGHRPQSKFCSDKHRTYFNRLSAAEQKERRTRARELQRSQREGQS